MRPRRGQVQWNEIKCEAEGQRTLSDLCGLTQCAHDYDVAVTSYQHNGNLLTYAMQFMQFTATLGVRSFSKRPNRLPTG